MFYHETLKDQLSQVKNDIKKIYQPNENINLLVKNIYNYASSGITFPKSFGINPRSDKEHSNPSSD